MAILSAELNHLCNFGRGFNEENLRNYYEFGPVVQEEMSFKDIYHLELWPPFYSEELNDLCNCGRGYYEEQFCETILYLDEWFRRRCNLNDFYLELLQPS